MNYFATFIPGAQEIIANRLQKFPNAQLEVLHIDDGVVVLASQLKPEQLSELRFFRNVYQLLAKDNSEQELPVPELPKPGTFIVRVRSGSQPTNVPPELVQHIVAQTGLEYTSHKPQHEFLLWRRNDGRTLWGMALPRAGFKLRRIEAGELRPDIAHIMGLVAGLDNKHTVLDPFAGYGGIVRECLQGFHAAEVIAVEQDEHLIPHLKSIPRLVALHGDARQLAHVHTRSIDRIITDPPWGDYEQYPHLKQLYHHALSQMHRVLRAKGVAVVLSAAPFLAETAAESSLIIEKQYPVLVSGHKATIYKLRKAS